MATEHDQAIARNFQRLRGNTTMDELAMRMRQVGHKWSRTTVYSIEHNERRLQASEAYDFLAVIGHDPDEDLPLLYRQISRTPVERAEREVSSHAEKLAADWNAYLMARSAHKRIIDREEKTAGITDERAGESLRFVDDLDAAIHDAVRDRKPCDLRTAKRTTGERER